MTKLAILFALSLVAIIVLADTSHLGVIKRIYDIPYGDKAGHFVLFGTLSLLVSLAMLHRTHRPRDVVLAAVTIALLEGLEELSQAWFPSRTLDWRDAAASWVGIGVGALAAVRITNSRRDEVQVGVIYRAHPARPGAVERADGRGTLMAEEIERVERRLRRARGLAAMTPLRRATRMWSVRMGRYVPGVRPSP